MDYKTTEELHAAIRTHAQSAMEGRQVWRRLSALLPSRLQQIRQSVDHHRRARAALQALASPEYTHHINELVSVSGGARSAKVQYETHMMLLQARQSLRRAQQSGANRWD
jgi:hypothetical protein